MLTVSSFRVATLTVSDSRTLSNDRSGSLLRDLLRDAGIDLVPHRIVSDEVDAIRCALRDAMQLSDVRAVVLSGGTGVGPRDVTIEAVEPVLAKHLAGFGEAFRHKSWEQVGARAMLSRALAGVAGRCLVVALPGSPDAVRLGAQLVLAFLPHAVQMIDGAGHRPAPGEAGS